MSPLSGTVPGFALPAGVVIVRYPAVQRRCANHLRTRSMPPCVIKLSPSGEDMTSERQKTPQSTPLSCRLTGVCSMRQSVSGRWLAASRLLSQCRTLRAIRFCALPSESMICITPRFTHTLAVIQCVSSMLIGISMSSSVAMSIPLRLAARRLHSVLPISMSVWYTSVSATHTCLPSLSGEIGPIPYPFRFAQFLRMCHMTSLGSHMRGMRLVSPTSAVLCLTILVSWAPTSPTVSVRVL
mmetsp:Transcript_29969/g.61681  ORF Transcript_29969/g.61681 Transcript_29969/m.61681 type:complete len:240 (-) Transcript_29969:1381-2100(-)